MISQYMSKLMHTSMTKDQDTLILGTISIPLEKHMLLLNSSKQITPTTGSNSSGDKTSGKPTKEEYTTAQTSAGGSNQTLSTQTTHSTFKSPVSLSLSQQLPQHFSNFLPAPIPQIIQLQWKDNRKKLTLLLAKSSKKHRGLTLLLIPLCCGQSPRHLENQSKPLRVPRELPLNQVMAKWLSNTLLSLRQSLVNNQQPRRIFNHVTLGNPHHVTYHMTYHMTHHVTYKPSSKHVTLQHMTMGT